jgi:hypothetical protein
MIYKCSAELEWCDEEGSRKHYHHEDIEDTIEANSAWEAAQTFVDHSGYAPSDVTDENGECTSFALCELCSELLDEDHYHMRAKDGTIADGYYCEKCRPETGRPPTPSRATKDAPADARKEE